MSINKYGSSNSLQLLAIGNFDDLLPVGSSILFLLGMAVRLKKQKTKQKIPSYYFVLHIKLTVKGQSPLFIKTSLFEIRDGGNTARKFQFEVAHLILHF